MALVRMTRPKAPTAIIEAIDRTKTKFKDTRAGWIKCRGKLWERSQNKLSVMDGVSSLEVSDRLLN